MRRVKHSVRALLFVVALLASLAVSSGTASATSVYDNTVRITQELTVKDDSFAAIDVSASYIGLIQENCSSEYYDSLTATVRAEGEYSISKFEHGTSDSPSSVNDNVVMVIWSEDGSGSLGFQTEYSTYKSLHVVGGRGVSYKSAQIYMDSEGDLGAQCMDSAQTSYLSTNQPGITAWDATVWLSTFNVTYPSGYEGQPIPTEAPSAKYVAMGDSFSSGEGNAPFEYGTDTGSNTCHRSPQAYPRLLQSDPNLKLGPTAFVACSGAVSNYIINEYNQENVELPQAAYVSSDTQLITITIGGNDVGFGDVLATCTLATKEEGTSEEKHQIEHDVCVEAIDDARDIATSTTLQSKLETVFSGLRSLGDQDLQVVVVGYPNLLPAFNNIVGSCTWAGDWFAPVSGRTVASDEVQKSRLLHDELNEAIESAVNATNDSHIHFIDPSSAFVGHELCRPSPWFNGAVLAVDPVMRNMSYHPNNNGQIAYATVVGAEVDNLFP